MNSRCACTVCPQIPKRRKRHQGKMVARSDDFTLKSLPIKSFETSSPFFASRISRSYSTSSVPSSANMVAEVGMEALPTKEGQQRSTNSNEQYEIRPTKEQRETSHAHI